MMYLHESEFLRPSATQFASKQAVEDVSMLSIHLITYKCNTTLLRFSERDFIEWK